MKGIHSADEFPHTGFNNVEVDVFVGGSSKKLLNKPYCCQWFDTTRHSCDVPLMIRLNFINYRHFNFDSCPETWESKSRILEIVVVSKQNMPSYFTYVYLYILSFFFNEQCHMIT